ncbi:MAG TPA: COX15/CtaA family protein [Actinomycetota bacterium]|nr:COX15/CtaA family protein [Actinomycetota bacterium]
MPSPDLAVVDRTGFPLDEPGTGLQRGRAALRVLALGSTILTALLIAVGGVVRATESGLGCPGWPKCFGRWVPPLEYHAIIEYSHRAVALIVGVVIAALAVVATAFFRRYRRVFVPAAASLVLVVVQGALGRIVVKGELEALLVTAHFSTAMILLGTLTYGTVSAYSLDAPTGRRDGSLPALAWLVAGSVFVLMVLGAFVRGEGASLAFFDWPLMDGAVIPALDSLPPALHFTHRVAALVTGVLVALLGMRAWRNRRLNKAAAVLAGAMLGVFLVQVLVGAANVWTRLADPAVASHVALAGLVWALAVATAATSRLAAARMPDLPRPAPELVGQR